ncbi:hypothetical protein P0D69_28115 [Paraburkholderia sediminicola]|uniref:hypothetical protein n=1 Tax=Paraburkholderia sediminicola TaxID=458836 RepID=UPI0038BAEA4F
MSNNKTPTNAFSATNQPTPGNTRGKSPKTKALSALKRIMGWSEDDLYDYIATEAFQNDNKDMMETFIKSAVATARTTLPTVEFQYDRNAPYHEKAEVVMEAMSKGELPPDVGLDIINSIKHIATVHEQHELAKRIEQLEALLMHATSSGTWAATQHFPPNPAFEHVV